MNKKMLKDLALLAAIIIIAAAGARFLAGGETLSDYAVKHPDKAGIAATKESTEAVSEASAEASAGAGEASSLAASVIEASTDSSAAKEISTEYPAIASTEASSEIEASAKASSVIEAEPSPDRVTYQEGFYYEPISNAVFSRISGISYPVDCTVPLDELRYVGLKYVDFNGDEQDGELICNKDLAQDMVEIFYELYTNAYQLESVKLVDDFGGDDTASMLANNTSCFNYRVVEGTTRLSNHAYGRAIDVNPFYNPYITYNKDGSINISPAESEAYADRSAQFPYKIDENDLAYKLFKEHGFKWGGDWNNSKDYQHFEKK